MIRIKILILIAIVFGITLLVTEQANKSEGCCPRGGTGGGSSGGGSPAPVPSRPPLGPGIQPLIQSMRSGGSNLLGTAEPWEAWWTRNRELYLNVHQPIEWVKIIEGGTKSVKRFEVYDRLIELLIKGVEEKDQYVAFRSAVALGMAKAEPSNTALKKAYAAEKRFFVKNNVVFGLGLTGDAQCAEIVRETLANKGPALSRCYAAAALGFVNDPAVIKLLHEIASQKEDAEVLCCAALSLGNIGDLSSIPILVKLLNPIKGQELRKDGRIRVHAALALGRIGRKIASAPAGPVKVATEGEEETNDKDSTPQPSADAEVRKSILAELGKSAADKDRDVRAAVAIALGLMKAEESKDILLNMLKDSTGLVRGLAAVALTQSGIKDIYDTLNKALQKSGEEDKGLIIIALGLLGDEKIKPKLREIVQSRKEKMLTKGAAAIALGLLKDTEAIQPLAEIIKKQDNPSLSPYVILTLGMIGDGNAVEPLKKKWEDVDNKNINAIAYTNLAVALTLLGKRDELVIPRLLKHCAKDAPETLKVYAFHTLGIIGTRDIAQTFVDAFNDENTTAEVRKSIVTGVGFLLDKNSAPQINRFTAESHFDIYMIIMDHILPIPVW